MNPINKVLIVGAGAVGAAVASKIYNTFPAAVSVLASGERLARYRNTGFILNGKRFDFPLALPDDSSVADLIIVAVKSHHLDDAISMMKNKVGPNTTILSLLNGISSEESLSAAFGKEKVLLAMILGIDAVRIGNDTRFSSSGKIHFGIELNPENAWHPQVRAVAEFFDKTGVPYIVPENMTRSLWYKFMINVGINQASAVLRSPYRVFQTIPEARAVMESGMREVIALSKIMGTGLEDADLERWTDTLMALGPEGVTSMLQDVEAKRKTEVEIFSGTVIELGKKAGLATPVNDLWFNLIRTIEKTY